LGLIGRIIATWLIAMALVLVVIDGTRTLGEQRVVITSIGTAWGAVEQVTSPPNHRQTTQIRASGNPWLAVLSPLGGLPGWLVFGLPGFAVALASRRTRRYYNGIDHV